jgi:hypothetical protein
LANLTPERLRLVLAVMRNRLMELVV